MLDARVRRTHARPRGAPSATASPRRPRLLERLTGGDRRSIGRSDEVVADVLREPSLLADLVAGLRDDDALVRMRAADAAEKVSARHPEWLAPHRRQLLECAAVAEQQELRWHLALMLPRLPLCGGERERVVALLKGWLADKSAIVRTFCMQGLADLARQDASLRARVIPLLRHLAETGTPAMQSRGRRLLAALGEAP